MVKLAEMALNEKKYEEVSERIEEILKINPKSHEGIFLKGRLHLVKNEFNEAVSLFQPYVSTNPKSFGGHYFLALAHLGNGDIQQGKNELAEAIKITPP
jgi:tetratricopeptide (TPR) repeat protein